MEATGVVARVCVGVAVAQGAGDARNRRDGEVQRRFDVAGLSCGGKGDLGIVMADPDKKIHRRDFFRKGLLELFKPIDKAIEPLHRAASEFKKLEQSGLPQQGRRATPGSGAPAVTEVSPFLRPPGAIGDGKFYETCTKSRECLAVCPAHAIHMDPEVLDGKPYIDVDRQPCLMCPEVPCSKVCGSGALVATALDQMKIGLARWSFKTCKRTDGEDCRLCMEVCPIKGRAIEILDHLVIIHEDACTGCGLCRRICPSSPRSIVIDPLLER